MHRGTIQTAFALVLLSASCGRTADPARPSPLQFQAKTFEKILPGCGDRSKREQPCVTFRVNWVEVSAAPDAAVQAIINTAIRARLHSKDAPPGFDAEAAAVVEEFQRFQKEFPDSELAYFVRRTAEVIFSNAHLLSVEFNEEDFQGGAHPNTHRVYLNAAPATGQITTLAELLVPDGMARLEALAEQRFRADRQIEAGMKLSDAGFNFPDDKFTLSKDWGASPAGLVIHYNDYEIAPHSTGPTTIVLPWSDIRVLIRKEAGIVPAK